MSMHRLLQSMSVAAGVAVLASGAAAPASAAEARSASRSVIEEIVVVARKREESLLEVPGAVSAFSAEQIKDQTVSDLTDLGSKIPNVLMSSGGSSGTVAAGITVRGISSQSAGPGFPPGIGVYLDGVFLGRDRAFNTVLNDIEAVEVLRGPQGTLYGKNTIAGAINIRTKAPTNEFSADADLTYGTDDLVQLRGTVNLPLIEDRLLLRVSGLAKDQDGFIENRLTGDDQGEIEARGARARLLFKASETLELDLQADYFKQDDDLVLETLQTIALPFPPYNQLPANDVDDRSVALNTPDFGERDLQGVSGRITWDIGDYELVSISAYREYDSDFGDDSDGVELDEFNVGREENFDHFTQELRLSSPGTNRFNWILGAYYEEEDLESFRRLRLGPQFPTPILMLPPIPNQETASTDVFIDGESFALFGSFTYDLTDELELSGGLRYTSEEKDISYTQLPTQIESGAIFAFVVPIPELVDSYDEDEVSGDVSLSWEASPGNVLYGRYSRGFKAGGFQADVISPPATAGSIDFDPEFVDAYEIGYKGVIVDGRLLLNAAAFYYDFTDKQEQVNTGVSFIVSNAGETENYGAEIEVLARLMEGLDLQASLGVLDAEYKAFPDGGGLGVDYDGNDLAGAPEYTGSVNLQYVRPIGSGLELYLRGEVDFRDGFFTDPANNPNLEIDSATFVNARVGLRREDQAWSVYLFGQNLNDEDVIGGGQSTLFNTLRSINRGRVIGAELRVSL